MSGYGFMEKQIFSFSSQQISRLIYKLCQIVFEGLLFRINKNQNPEIKYKNVHGIDLTTFSIGILDSSVRVHSNIT